jgi:predicted CoA-binding protein
MSEADDLLREFLQRPVWAVVGASRDPRRYGHRVLVALRKAGYRAYAVNPSASEIAGEPTYPSLSALPEVPDVVDTVVPPEVTLRTVEDAARLGVTRIWMQPGSESDEAIRRAEESGMQVVHHACAMVGALRGPARAREYSQEDAR